MFVGNLWILLKSQFAKTPVFPSIGVAELNEIPVRGGKLFNYPKPQDHCITIHTSEREYVAYSQKCTHLSCAVYCSAKNDRLECLCHQGFFSVTDGSVLQSPPLEARQFGVRSAMPAVFPTHQETLQLRIVSLLHGRFPLRIKSIMSMRSLVLVFDALAKECGLAMKMEEGFALVRDFTKELRA
jgi:nitrite reductase/ring-hydroxylating ferredoxin subunit